jgi:hypothetical protein
MQTAMQRSLGHSPASSSNRVPMRLGVTPVVCTKTHISEPKLGIQSVETGRPMLGLQMDAARRRGYPLRAIEYATYGADMSFPLEGYMVLVRM